MGRYKQYKRQWQRQCKKLVRRIKKSKGLWPALVAFVVMMPLIAVLYYQAKQPKVDLSSYQALLNTIAKGESNGNYNAYYGNATNTKLRFTDMTVDEVRQWQDGYVNAGSRSSAVGKYQIVRSTLNGLVDRLDIDGSARFDEALQDRLGIALLERRGARDFIRAKLTREQFAANLAKEWAALPKVVGPNPADSYYAGDGLNKSRISIDEVLAAVDRLRAAG